MSTGPRDTEQAMALLKATRAYYIAWGKRIAHQIAQFQGEVMSYEVVEAMEAQGVLPQDDPTGRFWVGAVFNRNKSFVWTGCVGSHSRSDRNLHERTVRVWALTEAARTQPAPAAPKPPTEQLELPFADTEEARLTAWWEKEQAEQE